MKFGIIAAGLGSRLTKEGIETPKPLVRLNGEPLIGRLMRIFCENGAETITVVINSDMPEVGEYIREFSKISECPIKLVVKSTPSSMHTFKVLVDAMEIEGKFVVTTVDTVFQERNFREYIKSFNSSPDSINGIMGVTPFIDDEKPLYVKVDDKDLITAFSDNSFDGVKYISAGIYGLTPACIKVLDSCIQNNVSRMRNYQRALIDSGLRIKAFDIGKVIDVDHVSDIRTAEQFISSDKR